MKYCLQSVGAFPRFQHSICDILILHVLVAEVDPMVNANVVAVVDDPVSTYICWPVNVPHTTLFVSPVGLVAKNESAQAPGPGVVVNVVTKFVKSSLS